MYIIKAGVVLKNDLPTAILIHEAYGPTAERSVATPFSVTYVV